jgi:hypothetical protein
VPSVDAAKQSLDEMTFGNPSGREVMDAGIERSMQVPAENVVDRKALYRRKVSVRKELQHLRLASGLEQGGPGRKTGPENREPQNGRARHGPFLATASLGLSARARDASSDKEPTPHVLETAFMRVVGKGRLWLRHRFGSMNIAAGLLLTMGCSTTSTLARVHEGPIEGNVVGGSSDAPGAP